MEVSNYGYANMMMNIALIGNSTTHEQLSDEEKISSGVSEVRHLRISAIANH